MLLKSLDARAKPGELAGHGRFVRLPRRRLGGALLGVEGACRPLVDEAR
jgi:hypothetical protein